jgi:hypothetical protein
VFGDMCPSDRCLARIHPLDRSSDDAPMALATRLQSEDRQHRSGQHNPGTCVDLLAALPATPPSSETVAASDPRDDDDKALLRGELEARSPAQTRIADLESRGAQWETVYARLCLAKGALVTALETELAATIEQLDVHRDRSQRLAGRVNQLEVECAQLRGECDDVADRDAEIYQLRAGLVALIARVRTTGGYASQEEQDALWRAEQLVVGESARFGGESAGLGGEVGDLIQAPQAVAAGESAALDGEAGAVIQAPRAVVLGESAALDGEADAVIQAPRAVAAGGSVALDAAGPVDKVIGDRAAAPDARPLGDHRDDGGKRGVR